MQVTERGVQPGDDRGFTMIELVIVALIASLVLGSILGILENQSRAERRVTAVAANQELVRQALVTMQRDLRSADSLIAPADPATAPRRVDLFQVDFESGAKTQIRWRISTTTGQMTRESVAPSGAVTTTYRLSGLAPTSVFRYFDGRGAELSTGNGTAATLAACTARVRIEIAAAPEAGPAPIAVVSDVELRNRRRSNGGCSG